MPLSDPDIQIIPWWYCEPKVPVTPCPIRPTGFVVFADYDSDFKYPLASSRMPIKTGGSSCACPAPELLTCITEVLRCCPSGPPGPPPEPVPEIIAYKKLCNDAGNSAISDISWISNDVRPIVPEFPEQSVRIIPFGDLVDSLEDFSHTYCGLTTNIYEIADNTMGTMGTGFFGREGCLGYYFGSSREINYVSDIQQQLRGQDGGAYFPPVASVTTCNIRYSGSYTLTGVSTAVGVYAGIGQSGTNLVSLGLANDLGTPVTVDRVMNFHPGVHTYFGFAFNNAASYPGATYKLSLEMQIETSPQPRVYAFIKNALYYELDDVSEFDMPTSPSSVVDGIPFYFVEPPYEDVDPQFMADHDIINSYDGGCIVGELVTINPDTGVELLSLGKMKIVLCGGD